MGGSGGGSTARYDPQRIKDLIRSAEDRTRDTGYETEVSGELADLRYPQKVCKQSGGVPSL